MKDGGGGPGRWLMARASGSNRRRSRASGAKPTAAPPSPARVPALAPRSAPNQAPGRPGQRLYDLPYGAPAPRLVNPSFGLHNLVARAGHNAAYEIDVTLLDAPDHRLIRSGRAACPSGAGRAGRVVPGRAGLAAAAAEGPDRADGPRRPARGAGGPDPARSVAGPLWAPSRRSNCDRREFALSATSGGRPWRCSATTR